MSSTMKRRQNSTDEQTERQPEVFGPSESEGREFGSGGDTVEAASNTRDGKAIAHKATGKEATRVDFEDGSTLTTTRGKDGNLTTVDEQAANAKHLLLEKIQKSNDAIHAGVENALLSIIAKKLGDLSEDKRKKVLEVAKNKAAERFQEWGLEQLRSPVVRESAKKMASKVGVVVDLKEIADASHAADIAKTETKVLRDLAAAVDKNADGRYGAARKYVETLDAEECVDIAAGLTPTPEFSPEQVSMEFQAVLEAAMRDSGVLTAAEQIDSVQRTIELQYEGSAEEK